MKKLLTTISVTLLVSGSALANGSNHHNSNNSNSSKADASSVSVSNSSSSASVKDSGNSASFSGVNESGNSSIKNSGNSASFSKGGDSDSKAKIEDNSTTVYHAQKRNPVSTAFAAPLVAADDTCMGSSSAGAQGVGFGVSLGSTWQDGDCVRRKDARELHNMGHRKAALALMCQNDNVAKAMEASGTPCIGRDADEMAKLSPSAGGEIKRGDQEVVYVYPTAVRRF